MNYSKAVSDHKDVVSGLYLSVNGREESHLALLETSLFCSGQGCRHKPAFGYCSDLQSKLETAYGYSEKLPLTAIKVAAGYEATKGSGMKMKIIHWGEDQHSLLIGPFSPTDFEEKLADLRDKLDSLGVAKCRKQLIGFNKEE